MHQHFPPQSKYLLIAIILASIYLVVVCCDRHHSYPQRRHNHQKGLTQPFVTTATSVAHRGGTIIKMATHQKVLGCVEYSDILYQLGH